MQQALPKAVVILLWYFGVLGATPAPDGWQTYRGPGFAVHLPAGWEELQAEATPGGAQAAGKQQVFHFSPQGQPAGDTRVTLLISEDGKVDPSDASVLLNLQNDYPRALAEELQEGQTCSVVSTVYDDARYRLWFRIEALPKEGPPLTYFFLFLLTETGSLQIGAVAPAGYPGLQTTFQEIVNSLELDEELRFKEPEGMSARFPNSLMRLGFDSGLALGSLSLKNKPAFTLLLSFLVLIGASSSVLLVVDPLIFRGRLKAFLIRRLQRLPFHRPAGEQAALPRLEVTLRRLPLRWSLALQIALAPFVAFGMAPRLLANPQLYRLSFVAPCYLLGYAMLVLAVALHYIPGTSRRLKYELLAAAFTVLAVPGILVDPWTQADIIGQDPATMLGGFYGLFLAQTVYFVLAGVVVRRLLRAKGNAAERRASTLHRLTQRFKAILPLLVGLVPTLPVGSGLGCGFAFLVACYLIGEKALERPILYLRSYHDHNTSLVLAKIVLPMAVRFAPVLATAHALQPPEELYRRANSLISVRLKLLPNAAWQEWILAVLPRCQAVLIDVSVASASLLWELEHARAVLPAERIIVMAQEEAPHLDLPGVTILRYRLGWRGRWAARKALHRWLKQLGTVPSVAEAPSPLTSMPA